MCIMRRCLEASLQHKKTSELSKETAIGFDSFLRPGWPLTKKKSTSAG